LAILLEAVSINNKEKKVSLISMDAGSDAKTVYTNKALGTVFDHSGVFSLSLSLFFFFFYCCSFLHFLILMKYRTAVLTSLSIQCCEEQHHI